MNDLIEALQIFSKYTNTKYPTWCEHDVMHICDVNPDEVSQEDLERLDDLGFFVSQEDGEFMSYRFGSA